MQPRIQATIGLENYDEWFENTQAGWDAAWVRFNEFSTMQAASQAGSITFEYCGHKAQPPQNCLCVQSLKWGGEDNVV